MVRIAAITAGILVALVVLSVIGLLLFVNPNDYRGRIEQVVQQRTGRQLTIAGKLELKVFPWLALSVQDLRLGNPPEFGTQPFLTVHDVSIGVKLLPLLTKRLEVSRIAVDGLSVKLISRAQTNNWNDLTEPKSPPAAAPAGGGATPAASVAGLEIRNSVLSFTDETQKSATELSISEIRTGRLLSSTAPARVELKDLVVRGTLLQHSPNETPAQSRPMPFSLQAPEVALDTQAQTLGSTTVSARVGDLTVLLSAAGEKIFSNRILHGTLTVPKVPAREVLQSLGITAPATRDPHALSALALRTNYRLTQKQLQLSGLDLTLDDTRMQGSAGVDDLERMALSFDLKVNSINLDRYRPPVEVAKAASAKSSPPATVNGPPAGVKGPQAPTPLPITALRKLDAHGTLRVSNVTFAGLLFTAVTMPLAAKDGHVHLGPTQARLYGGTYDGDIVLDARPVQAQLSLNEHVHSTDMGALVKAAFETARVTGHADANVAVSGVGNTDEAMMRSLSGKIDVKVKQGALNGIDIMYALQSAAALLKREVPPRHTGPERTVFNSLQASATLDKGVLRNNDLQIETDFLKVHGGGTLEVATEALDYRLVAALYQVPPPSDARSAGGNLATLKSVEVPLIVTGTVANPTVRPDIEALAKGQLRQEVNKRVQQKAGDLKKKLGDKLKDLFSH